MVFGSRSRQHRGRCRPPGTGRLEPAGQRGQVHAGRRMRGRCWTGTAATRGLPSPTTDAEFPPTSCRTSSSSSGRPPATMRPPTVEWAWAWPWSGIWPRPTAEPSAPKVPAPAAAHVHGSSAAETVLHRKWAGRKTAGGSRPRRTRCGRIAAGAAGSGAYRDPSRHANPANAEPMETSRQRGGDSGGEGNRFSGAVLYGRGRLEQCSDRRKHSDDVEEPSP